MTGGRPSSGHHSRTCLHTFHNELFGPRPLPARRQRPHFRRGIERRADPDLRGPLRQALQQWLMERLVHEQPRPRHAGLSRRSEDAGHDRARCAVEVRVRKHDHRRFTPKFERGHGEVHGGVAHDLPRRFRPAGERHARDQGVAGKRGAAVFTEAGQDVHHALGKSRFADELGEMQERRWTILGGLEHDTVACRQRRSKLDRREEELRIPRHDGGNDP